MEKHTFEYIFPYKSNKEKKYASAIDGTVAYHHCIAILFLSFFIHAQYEATIFLKQHLDISFQINVIPNTSHTQRVRKLATRGSFICEYFEF